MDKNKLGFYDPSTGTFMVVENEEVFKMVLRELSNQQKA